MLIAILVLLGIAGTIWYFAHKQTHTSSSVPADQTAKQDYQIDPNADLFTAATESTSVPTSPSVEQIDTALATSSVEVPKPAKKKRRYYPKKK